MRVFIAIPLDESVKNVLESLQKPFRAQAQRGNFTAKINFHLTLAFLGEVSEAENSKLMDLIDGLDFEPFELSLSELGSFNRKDGIIWWIGVHKHHSLQAIHDQIVSGLRERQLPFDESPYVPHLTLVRNYRAKSNQPIVLPKFDPCLIRVNRIALMSSARLHGELRYTEIYHHESQRTL